MKQGESVIRDAIIRYVESLGGVCTKVFCGQGQLKYGGYVKGATPGTHDLQACLKGNYISIEVKKDEKEVAKWNRYDISKLPINKAQERIYNQRGFAEKIKSAGGLTCCVGSVLEFRKFLSQTLPESLQYKHKNP